MPERQRPSAGGWPFVSVIVVHRNGKRLLADCLDALSFLDYPPESREVVLVDNGSGDGSLGMVRKKYPAVRILSNEVNNYARANNLGINAARGEYVALLNNDAEPEPRWLSELVLRVHSDPRVGAAGGKILFFDGRIQSAGHEQFPNYQWGDRGFLEPDAGQYASVEEIISVSNAAALYKKEALIRAGLFDEDFDKYMEDLDMNYRLRTAGYRVLFVPQSVVFHKLHGSRLPESSRRVLVLKNRLRFLAKHFPQKLPEHICGLGDILWLDDATFGATLEFIAEEVKRRWGQDKKLEAEVTASLVSLAAYRARCGRIGRANLQSLFRTGVNGIKRFFRFRE